MNKFFIYEIKLILNLKLTKPITNPRVVGRDRGVQDLFLSEWLSGVQQSPD